MKKFGKIDGVKDRRSAAKQKPGLLQSGALYAHAKLPSRTKQDAAMQIPA
jgi:hypothetical protein